METLTTQLQENRQALDSLLGVGRNYDIISRDIDIGRRQTFNEIAEILRRMNKLDIRIKGKQVLISEI